jgi:outer membrane cobalamin receptor
MSERQHRQAAAGSRVLSFALASLCVPFCAVFCALSCVPSAALAAAGAAADADTSTAPVYVEEGVVVTASRYGSDVHLSHTDLTGGELRRSQAALDLPLLLQDVPGLFAYGDAGSGLGYTYLKIRGFDQRRVAVLINGVPQNDPEDHQV